MIYKAHHITPMTNSSRMRERYASEQLQIMPRNTSTARASRDAARRRWCSHPLLFSGQLNGILQCIEIIASPILNPERNIFWKISNRKKCMVYTCYIFQLSVHCSEITSFCPPWLNVQLNLLCSEWMTHDNLNTCNVMGGPSHRTLRTFISRIWILLFLAGLS